MLKSNTRKARENIANYILKNFDGSNYDIEIPATIENYSEICANIYQTFCNETQYDRRRMTEQQRFIEWCGGLPSILDTCYYYNRSAVTDLGDILEESESERERFSEAEAEKMLTRLLYREIVRCAA